MIRWTEYIKIKNLQVKSVYVEREMKEFSDPVAHLDTFDLVTDGSWRQLWEWRVKRNTGGGMLLLLLLLVESLF